MPSFAHPGFVIRYKEDFIRYRTFTKVGAIFSLRFVEQDRFLARCCPLHPVVPSSILYSQRQAFVQVPWFGSVCWYSQKANNGQNTPCITHRVQNFRVRYRAHVGEFQRFLQWIIRAIKSHELTPICFQNFTVAQFTAFACTERWISISGKFSRTNIIKPGSDIIKASGPMSIWVVNLLIKVLSLELCGAMFTTT